VTNFFIDRRMSDARYSNYLTELRIICFFLTGEKIEIDNLHRRTWYTVQFTVD